MPHKSGTVAHMGNESRGAAIRRRLLVLGVTDREFQERSGIDRKTLKRAVEDDPTVRPNTYKLIEDWLDASEAQHRLPPEDLPRPKQEVVKFELSGNFGVNVVVSGPVENLAEMRRQIAILIREMGDGDIAGSTDADDTPSTG